MIKKKKIITLKREGIASSRAVTRTLREFIALRLLSGFMTLSTLIPLRLTPKLPETAIL